MSTSSETLALERPQQQDEFLALIEKVALNPEIDAEKLKVIVGLKLQLEDRAAEKAFDAAMQEAQKEVQALRWDKINRESNNSRWVSFPKIDDMLKPIREKFGFSESFGVEKELPAPNLMMMYSDVTYKGPEGTHRRRFHLPMSISGEGPKGNGVMTAAQAVGNGCSLGMRYIEKMVWKIPMLVDKDDNDGNPISRAISDVERVNLEKMMKDDSQARRDWFLKQFGIQDLSELPRTKYQSAVDKINLAHHKDAERKATISEDQEATLVAMIDGIGGNCKADFLKANQIKKVSELPASQYQGALAALHQQQNRQ